MTVSGAGVTPASYRGAVSVPTQVSLFDPLSVGGVVVDTTLVGSVELHPAVAAWFRARFPDGPTEAQTAAWPPIAAGEHTLVAAPTGSGKTLAGFLMAINGLYLAFARGEPITGTRVVYVSPLKALAVDIAENLERPLAGIAAKATELGLAHPDIRRRGPHRRHLGERTRCDGPLPAARSW